MRRTRKVFMGAETNGKKTDCGAVEIVRAWGAACCAPTTDRLSGVI
jgi:hypothetical protein